MSAIAGTLTLHNSIDSSIGAGIVNLTIAAITAKIESKRNRAVPLPRIPVKSRHFLYAVCIANGYSFADACMEVGCSERTAERWRSDLCKAAAAHYGFDVQYFRVASDIVAREQATWGQNSRNLKAQHPPT